MKKPRTCVKCQAVGDGYKFAPASQKNMCAACYSEYKTTKHLAAEAQRNKVCKRCGKAFYNKDKRQVVCSLKCDGAAELVACAACSRQCRRSKRRENKNVACSAACQHVLLQVGASKKAKIKSITAKQSKARHAWYLLSSKARRQKNAWLETIKKESQRVLSTNNVDQEWEKRCAAALSAISIRRKRQRKVTACQKKNQDYCFQAVAIREMRRMTQIRLRASASQWARRVQNSINLMRKRRHQFAL